MTRAGKLDCVRRSQTSLLRVCVMLAFMMLGLPAVHAQTRDVFTEFDVAVAQVISGREGEWVSEANSVDRLELVTVEVARGQTIGDILVAGHIRPDQRAIDFVRLLNPDVLQDEVIEIGQKLVVVSMRSKPRDGQGEQIAVIPFSAQRLVAKSVISDAVARLDPLIETEPVLSETDRELVNAYANAKSAYYNSFWIDPGNYTQASNSFQLAENKLNIEGLRRDSEAWRVAGDKSAKEFNAVKPGAGESEVTVKVQFRTHPEAAAANLPAVTCRLWWGTPSSPRDRELPMNVPVAIRPNTLIVWVTAGTEQLLDKVTIPQFELTGAGKEVYERDFATRKRCG